MQFHFLPAGIEDPERKLALLITLFGAETNRKVRVLVTPRPPSDVYFAELVLFREKRFIYEDIGVTHSVRVS